MRIPTQTHNGRDMGKAKGKEEVGGGCVDFCRRMKWLSQASLSCGGGE